MEDKKRGWLPHWKIKELTSPDSRVFNARYQDYLQLN